jgi:hypothetical protein
MEERTSLLPRDRPLSPSISSPRELEVEFTKKTMFGRGRGEMLCTTELLRKDRADSCEP